MPCTEDLYYTRQEVAQLLNVDERTVNNYAKQGKIEVIPNPYKFSIYLIYTIILPCFTSISYENFKELNCLAENKDIPISQILDGNLDSYFNNEQEK